MAERIIAAVYGIALASTPFSAKQISIGVRLPVGSIGAVTHPENALFFTDRRILVAAVPLPAVGLSVGGHSISAAYSLAAVGKLKEKGEEMIRAMGPQQILDSNEKNFEIPYESIIEATIKKRLFLYFGYVVSFKLTGNKSYKYVLYRKEQFELLNQILAKLIPNKLK
ncbi:MAG: hypothetical protein Q7J54_01740 [Candidatus Woesearchaeota archaeon]|nr:hypothetical protein [Candidatus Woesearchaeota archaeon]